MAKPVVYGTPLSSYVRSLRMTLMEKGVDHDHVDVGVLDGACREPEHLLRNPFGKVPAFEHEGFRLYETNAIVRYVDEAFDGPALSPATLKARARMSQVMSIHDYKGYNSMVLDVVGYHFFPGFVGGQDPARLASGKQTAAICLSEYDRLLGDQPYLAGEALSLADLYIAPAHYYLSLTPEAEELLAPYPRLTAWWQRMSSRASAQATQPSFD